MISTLVIKKKWKYVNYQFVFLCFFFYRTFQFYSIKLIIFIVLIKCVLCLDVLQIRIMISVFEFIHLIDAFFRIFHVLLPFEVELIFRYHSKNIIFGLQKLPDSSAMMNFIPFIEDIRMIFFSFEAAGNQWHSSKT